MQFGNVFGTNQTRTDLFGVVCTFAAGTAVWIAAWYFATINVGTKPFGRCLAAIINTIENEPISVEQYSSWTFTHLVYTCKVSRIVSDPIDRRDCTIHLYTDTWLDLHWTCLDSCSYKRYKGRCRWFVVYQYCHTWKIPGWTAIALTRHWCTVEFFVYQFLGAHPKWAVTCFTYVQFFGNIIDMMYCGSKKKSTRRLS